MRDTGIGIPAEHIPRITERFYRVDRGRSRATGGTGLGLAIVKRITHRHQGRFVFETASNRGSTFTMCLPATRLLADPAAPREAVPDDAGAPSLPADLS